MGAEAVRGRIVTGPRGRDSPPILSWSVSHLRAYWLKAVLARLHGVARREIADPENTHETRELVCEIIQSNGRIVFSDSFVRRETCHSRR